MNQQKGMTLVEILIAVAVIGILSAIAYPSYQKNMLKGYRSQAMADLMKIQLRLEEQYTQHGDYKFDLTVSAGTCSFCETEPSRYQFSIDDSGSSPAERYVLAAKPQKISGQHKDACGVLYLNAIGMGSAENEGNCW